MKQEIWQEDQPVLQSDLDWAQQSKEQAITERLLDLFNPGVLLGSQLGNEAQEFLISAAAGLNITVGTGVAFSPAGERIVIPAVFAYSAANLVAATDNGIGGTTLTPQSTGSQNIPLNASATNRVWLGYLKTIDPTVFTLSESTNQRLFVQAGDGFQIVITTTNINPDPANFILIGEVITSGSAVVGIRTDTSVEVAAPYVVTVPSSSPYQVVLPVLPNLAKDQQRPASIPVITNFTYVPSGFTTLATSIPSSSPYTVTIAGLSDIPSVVGYTYVTGTPVNGQYAVNLSTGVITFSAANAGSSVSIVYTTGISTTTSAASQFTVDFDNGLVVFNAANAGANVTINYDVARVRRQYALSRADKIGSQITLNQVPSTYTAGAVVTLHDHLNARGGGVVSASNPHGTTAADIGLVGLEDLGGILADSGIAIEGGDASVVNSALSPSAVSASLPQDNYVVIAPLAATESVNINGTVVTATNIPAQISFSFVDPDTLAPITAGTYYFYVDPESKAVQRKLGSFPDDSFPIASIVWQSSRLTLPIQDLRSFGTTTPSNLRLETVLALSTGAPVDNRDYYFYNARMISANAVTAPTYAYVGLSGTTLTLSVDGTPYTITFPTDNTLAGTVAAINTQVSTLYAVATSDNKIQLLAAKSLSITSGSALSILGFVAGQTDNETASFTVTASNQYIDFKVNGGPALTATITNGTWIMGLSDAEPGTLCNRVAQAMASADSSHTYEVTFNAATNKVTISCSVSIELLWNTGTHAGSSARTLLGFSAVDVSGTSITSSGTTSSPTYVTSFEFIKEIRIRGNTSSTGVGGITKDAVISFTYDASTSPQSLSYTTSYMGNKTLKQTLTYNSDTTIKSIKDAVS